METGSYNDKTYRYADKYVQRANTEMTKQWNTRHPKEQL